MNEEKTWTATPKPTRSLDRKIEAAKRRAEEEKKRPLHRNGEAVNGLTDWEATLPTAEDIVAVTKEDYDKIVAYEKAAWKKSVEAGSILYREWLHRWRPL